MGSLPQSRLITEGEHNGVFYGKGVVLYGEVSIGNGSIIGDYSIIGRPNLDQIRDSDPPSKTIIGSHARLGPYVLVHSGSNIGNHCELEARATVGPETTLGAHSRILYGGQVHWNVQVGEHSKLAGFVCDRAVIGSNVIMFGQMLHCLNADDFDQATESSPTIEDRVRVGFDAKIIGGVKIGADSFIGANMLVVKDVAPGTILTSRRRNHTDSNNEDSP